MTDRTVVIPFNAPTPYAAATLRAYRVADPALVVRLVDTITALGWTVDQRTAALTRFADAVEAGRVVAQCPCCGLWWSDETPNSWWRRFDRCMFCREKALGVDRRLTDDEAAQFEIVPVQQSLWGDQ